MSHVESAPRHPERRNKHPEQAKSPYTGPERRQSPREDFGGDQDVVHGR